MKNIIKTSRNVVLALFLSTSLSYGASNTVAYQGVAFNNGAPVASQDIALKFTISNSSNAVIYQETKLDVLTTDKGFFSHNIGSGTRTAGAASYADVTWADDYKLKVEVDYANGTDYTDLGTQELTSSVYALKAKTADSATTAINATNAVNATTAVTTSGNAATATTASEAPWSGITSKPTTISGYGFTDVTNINTANTTVKRDGSGNFIAGTITAALNGNASTATTLATTRTISLGTGATGTATSFNGSSNITIPVTALDAGYLSSGTILDARLPDTISSNITGNAAAATNASNVYVEVDYNTEDFRYITFVDSYTAGNQRLNMDNGLRYSPLANTIYTNLSGNADSATTATRLETARTIGGVSFNGSGNIDLPGVNTAGTQSTSGNAATATYATTAGSATTCSNYLPLTGGTVSGILYASAATTFSYNTGAGTAHGAKDGSGKSAVLSYDWETVNGFLGTSDNEADTYSSAANGGNIKTSIQASWVVTASAFLAYSDKRIKENVRPLKNSLNIINKLNPVSYTKVDTTANGNRQETGFIAQEVKEILPSAVSVGKGDIPILKTLDTFSFEKDVTYKIQITKDAHQKIEDYVGGTPIPEGEIYVISKEVNDFHSIEYDVLYTHAIKAIQEQQSEIESLKDELTQIKNALKSNGINIK